MLVKKRTIAYQKTGEPIKGFTLPKEINMMIEAFDYFNVEVSGNAIIFSSGASIKPTAEQIKNYKFEGAII